MPTTASSTATTASGTAEPGRVTPSQVNAVDAMQRITAATSWTSAISADVGIILAFTAALVGGALALRRRTP